MNIRQHRSLSIQDTLIILSLFGILSCTGVANDASSTSVIDQETTKDTQSGWSKADSLWGSGQPAAGVPVRVSLAELSQTPLSLENTFLDSFTSAPPQFDIKVSKAVREGLTIGARAKQLAQSGTQGVLRIDEYELSNKIEPLKILPTPNLPHGMSLPFTLSTGATLRFARLFSTSEEAQAAKRLTPLDIPFSASQALLLPEGCVVEIPIEAQLSINLNGQLLTRGWSKVSELGRFITQSASGLLSSVAQGSLFYSGKLTVLIGRLKDEQIWIQVHRGHTQKKNVSLNTIVGANARTAFVPAAQVERARKFKDQLIKWGRTPGDWLTKTSARMNALRRGLPAILQGLVPEQGLPPAAAQLYERTDDVLALLEKTELWATDLADWVSREVNDRLGAVDRILNPKFDWIKRHSERVFNISLSLSLSAESSARIEHFGSYILDLSQDRGVFAFEHLLSGRTQWEGLELSGFSPTGFIDLSVVDALSQETHNPETHNPESRSPESHIQDETQAKQPAVQQLSALTWQSKREHRALRFSAPLLSSSLEEERQQHTVMIANLGEPEQRWELEIWRTTRQLSAGPVMEEERFTSGIIYPKSHISDHLEQPVQQSWGDGAYWFTWRKRFPYYAPTPLLDSLSETLNLTGTLGAYHGISERYEIDASGALFTQLSLSFNGEVLDQIFSESVDADLLWTTLADVASHFDNQFGLPFISAFIHPSLDNEVQVQACDTIAYEWGGHYCHRFLDTLILPLLSLQNGSIESQRDLLAGLFKQRLFANPIGARLLVRFLSELAVNLGMEEQTQLHLRLEHPTHPSIASPPLHEPLQSIGLDIAAELGIGVY